MKEISEETYNRIQEQELYERIDSRIIKKYSIAFGLFSLFCFLAIEYFVIKSAGPALLQLNESKAIQNTYSKQLKEERDQIKSIRKEYENILIDLQDARKKLKIAVSEFTEEKATYKSIIESQQNDIKQLEVKVTALVNTIEKHQCGEECKTTNMIKDNPEKKVLLNNSFVVSIVVYGNVSTPITTDIYNNLVKAGFKVSPTRYMDDQINNTKQARIFYNEKGQSKLAEISSALAELENLTVTLHDKVVEMKSADIAITFQPINTK